MRCEPSDGSGQQAVSCMSISVRGVKEGGNAVKKEGRVDELALERGRVSEFELWVVQKSPCAGTGALFTHD